MKLKLTSKTIRFTLSSILLIVLFFSVFLFMNNDEKQKKMNESDKPMEKNEVVTKLTSIYVDDFGAIGDGKSDDTKAIQNAVDSVVNGGSVIFDSEKKYRITDTINITKDITIISNNQKNATIFMDNNKNKKPALNFTGKVKYTTTIDSPAVKTRDNKIAIKDINNLQTGDLLLIESDTPWYFEPRTGTENLHKGELHRVNSIKDQEALLEEIIWGSYNSKTEKVTVSIIEPIKITLKENKYRPISIK